MPAFRCECPACKNPLQFNVATQGEVRINCPHCGHPFSVSVGQPDAAAPAVELDHDFFAALPPAQPQGRIGSVPQSSGSFRAPAPMTPAPRAPRTRTAPQQRHSGGGHSKGWIWLVLGGIGTMLLLGLVVGVVLLARTGSLPGRDLIDSVRMSMDSPENVIADLEQLSARVEAIGRAIPKGDESPAAAQPLIDATKDFDALLLRACRLEPQPVGVEESMAHLKEAATNSQSDAMQRNQPNDFFWHAKMNASPNEAVTKAITELTLLRAGVFAVVSRGIADLPSPFEYDGTEFEWTDEDRRLLAVIHLRGLMKRDFARELASADPAAPSAKSLSQLHSVIDRYAERARQLATRNKSNKLFVQVPRATPYQRQEHGASRGLFAVKKWCDSQNASDDALILHPGRAETTRRGDRGSDVWLGIEGFSCLESHLGRALPDAAGLGSQTNGRKTCRAAARRGRAKKSRAATPGRSGTPTKRSRGEAHGDGRSAAAGRQFDCLRRCRQ